MDDNYRNFLALYLAKDPEPPLDHLIEDDYEHQFTSGEREGQRASSGWHFASEQVEAHIEWLRRFGAAYREWVRD